MPYSLVAPWPLGRVPESESSFEAERMIILEALGPLGEPRGRLKAARVGRVSLQVCSRTPPKWLSRKKLASALSVQVPRLAKV